jgi:hypothetical protein
MADKRQDEREATFKFIEEVHNCLPVWDVSSAACKDTKNKQKEMKELLDERVVRPKGGISADIRFHPNLFISPPLSVSSPAINIK